MSTPKFTAPETPVTREEVYYDAILRGLNGDSPAPVIPTPVWRMEEYLAAIAEAASSGGGGSSLPPVTESDNGKVLAVEDGAWAADENTFVITASGSPATIDKTVAEILAALDAGKAVYLVDVSRTFVYLGKDGTNIYFAAEYFGVNRYYAYIALSNAKYTVSSYPKLPSAFASDNGSELIVKSGLWTKQQKKFVVTLTPTAADYSGTMDKTVAQINAAYEAGQEIVFRIYESPTKYYDLKVTLTEKTASDDYSVFGAYGILTEKLILFYADVIGNTYSTKIYSLTPAS